jgi:hypothetical protein
MTDGFDSMVRESERRERVWREHQAPRRREIRPVTAGKAGGATEVSPQSSLEASFDFIEDRVNPILEKLHAHGSGSLSPEEQHILSEAARRLSQKP